MPRKLIEVRSQSDPKRTRIYKSADGQITYKASKMAMSKQAEQQELDRLLGVVRSFISYTNSKADQRKTIADVLKGTDLSKLGLKPDDLRALRNDIGDDNIIDVVARFKDDTNNRVTSSETYADGAPEPENPFWLEADANALCKRALEEVDAAVASTIQQPTLETRKSIMSKETTTSKSTDNTEEISPAVLATSAMVTAKGIEINETGGAIYKASFAETFDEHTPAGLTPEVVEQAMEHLSRVAAGVSHAHGHAAVKASNANKSITKVTGSFPGPGRASLHLSYKHERSMPDGAGEGTKVVHGTMQVSWNNLGGPGGKNFDAVRSSVRRAAASSETSNS